MDTNTIQSLKELGIAIVSVAILGYIAWKLIQELAANRKDYSNFVQENNHQKADIIGKVSENIGANTEVTRQHTAVLERLLDKLEK